MPQRPIYAPGPKIEGLYRNLLPKPVDAPKRSNGIAAYLQEKKPVQPPNVPQRPIYAPGPKIEGLYRNLLPKPVDAPKRSNGMKFEDYNYQVSIINGILKKINSPSIIDKLRIKAPEYEYRNAGKGVIMRKLKHTFREWERVPSSEL